MKIVFIADVCYSTIGGVQVETRRLSRQLVQRGHGVWVISPSSSIKDIYYEDENVKVFEIASFAAPFFKSLRFVPFVLANKKIKKLLRSINPDLLHIQTDYTLAEAALLYAKRNFIPTVSTCHCIPGELEFTFKNSKFKSALVKKMVENSIRKISSSTDVCTVPSLFSRRVVSNLIGRADSIHYLSNGVDVRKFSKNKILSKKVKTILYVGRLEQLKNIETTIRAFDLVRKKIDSKLIIVGNGTDEARLKTLVKNLGLTNLVNFTGSLVEDAFSRYYKNADIFVILSVIENQPISILEALASGLPVIASDVGGVSEIVKDGKNGYLIRDITNSRLVAKYIIKIFKDSNLQKKLSTESLKLAKNHDINDSVSKLEGLYGKAVAINSLNVKLKSKENFEKRKYLVYRVALGLALFAILTRLATYSPMLAKAESYNLRAKLKNLKIVKSLEEVGGRIKSDYGRFNIKPD